MSIQDLIVKKRSRYVVIRVEPDRNIMSSPLSARVTGGRLGEVLEATVTGLAPDRVDALLREELKSYPTVSAARAAYEGKAQRAPEYDRE